MKGWIQFSPHGDLDRLHSFLSVLAEAKSRGDTEYHHGYLMLASAEMLDWFEPLTKAEKSEMLATFAGLTMEQIIEFGLIPGRDFRSMINNILDSEYQLENVANLSRKGIIEYRIQAIPYGGNAGLLALLECTGNRPIGHDDGSGYRRHTCSSRNLWRET